MGLRDGEKIIFKKSVDPHIANFLEESPLVEHSAKKLSVVLPYFKRISLLTLPVFLEHRY
jgi:hypothetical protein